MVCDDCSRRLSSLAAPDPWKGSGGPGGKLGENKALKKGVRSNPYGSACKVCRLKVSIQGATYCTQCAYGKGICAVCGKQVLDTTMYKMSEGVSMHRVQNRDEAAFKSAEQIERETAQHDLLAYLAEAGQVGRMPTRGAFEASGKGSLAAALVAAYGGLHAAADAMGLSKRLLNEEAEARKQAKREAAQHVAEELRAATDGSLPLDPPSCGGGPSASAVGEDATHPSGSDDGEPPGVVQRARTDTATGTSAPSAADRSAPTVPVKAQIHGTDPRWQYDPNLGLYFEPSSQRYFDADRSMYHCEGRWSR